MGRLALGLVLLLCLGAALAGRRGGSRPGKKGFGHGVREVGRDERYPQRGGGRRQHRPAQERPRRPFVRRQFRDYLRCDFLEPMMDEANLTLHQYKAKLHHLFGGLIQAAQSKPNFKRRRANLKKMLRKELGMAVEHQCRNAIEMVAMIKNCNHSGLQAFEETWRRHYMQTHGRVDKVATKMRAGNTTHLCLMASSATMHIRRRLPPRVRHMCQRLDLLKCIFRKTNMTLPSAAELGTTPPFVRKPDPCKFLLKKRRKNKKFWRMLKKCRKSARPDSDNDSLVLGDGNEPTPEAHRNKRRHGRRSKLVVGIGALLLIAVSVLLVVCFAWQRRKTARRNQLKVAPSESKDVWTTPTDSTVAYLQAKGWRNPVYYVLEDEAMTECPKVAL